MNEKCQFFLRSGAREGPGGISGNRSRRPDPGNFSLAKGVISRHSIPMSTPTYFVVSREQHEALVSAAYQHRGYQEDESAAAARMCS